MCGINGFVSLNHTYKDGAIAGLKSKIEAMNDTIVHRGPDSDGCYINNPIAFGFRRLSIIDLDDQANQPMLSDDGNYVLVFNGEIYNYLEIKDELTALGHQFSTNSDTEVILKSYEVYGEKCVEHFNGMWAFALYDFRKNRLFCSRDRLGVKPFYYAIIDNELFFSSELKAIHKVTGLSNANHHRVYQYLAYGYRMNDGETFFENCSELLPGTNLFLENDKIELKEFWSLKTDLYKHTASSHKEEFVNLFKSAVKLRYRSDVPVALLLSGGLDSSAIARVTDDLIESGDLPPTDINAFIASFPGFVDDETEIAREFIKSCKHIKLHEIRVDSKSIIDGFEELIYDFDHPVFSFNTVVHNNIMKACKDQGIKVVINGQGSDEALAGYDTYISGVFLLDQLLSRKGRFFKQFNAFHKLNGYSKTFLLKQLFKAFLNPSKASYLRAKYQEKSLSYLNEDFVSKNKRDYKTDYNFSLGGKNLDSYLLDQINNQGLNKILHYEDVSSMNQSIEIRSPFMDYRLMEFAFSIPNKLKIDKGRSKLVLRDTIGKSLPKSITGNRQKIGFNTPFNDYLEKDEEFRKYVRDLVESDSFRSKKIWDADKLAEVMKNPSEHPEFPFWRVINLEIWSRVFSISNL